MSNTHPNTFITNINFICAIGLAFNGYLIRRTTWDNFVSLHIVNGKLWWYKPPGNSFTRSDGSTGISICNLCGPDKVFDLQPEDIAAKDWEVFKRGQ